MNIREQLIRDEGLRLKPYRDTVGKLTIGVGRNLEDKGISRDEAMALLENDIKETEQAVQLALSWAVSLDPARFGALINLAFNMGIHGLLGFKKMLGHMLAGEWVDAARELLDSKYAQQVGLRAERLAKQIETGQWV